MNIIAKRQIGAKNTAQSIIHDLLQRPGRYDFYQAVRILCARNEPLKDSSAKINFACNLNFAPVNYPISSIEYRDYKIIMRSNIMSLAGTQGPLPLIYSEDFARMRPNQRRVLLGYLDIFSNRLLHIKYKIALKNWPGFDHNSLLSGSFGHIIRAFSGNRSQINSSGNNNIITQQLAPSFANPKNCTNLINFLAVLYKAHVEIKENCGVWLSTQGHQQMILGTACLNKRLAPALGRKVWIQDAKIRIYIYFAQSSAITDLYCQPDAFKKMHQQINYLLPTDIEYSLHIRLLPGKSNGAVFVLGKSSILSATTQL